MQTSTEKEILIIVDMQNGFCKGNDDTIKLSRKIAELKPAFDLVFATQYQNFKNSPFETILNWHGMHDADEVNLVTQLGKVDSIIKKWSYSCADCGIIEKLLNINNQIHPSHVYLAGVDTDCCILAFAIFLFEHSIRPIVLTDYCASSGGPEYHMAGLTCMKRLIGKNQLMSVRVTNREDLAKLRPI